MRIAMIGQKGIPARYGGIERHVEEISTRLASRGHEVLVYCRPYYTQTRGPYQGVRLVRLPSIRTRSLDCASHTLISTAHVLSMKPDMVHYHALGPAALSYLPRLAGAGAVATVHGLDWRGGKWGPAATWILKRCEYAACRFPNRTIVVSSILRDYFRNRYGARTFHIPNGVNIPDLGDTSSISRFGLKADGYYLFVGRLGPEKGCHTMVEAFVRSDTERRLVLVGSAALNQAYEGRLRDLADGRVVFAGEIYGEPLKALWTGAYAVIHPSVTEGMSLSLLEAMAHQRCIVVSDIPENMEVVGGCALAFRAGDVEDLSRVIGRIDREPGLARQIGRQAVARAREAYDWNRIVDALEQVYEGIGSG
jgi:glycosyltransferase involved in cell wall biosynthesis